jgi:ATP synthase protein I
MTTPEEDPLYTHVQRRAERHRRWQQDGEPSITRRLGQIGVLGWLIVAPILAGVFAGRWLDDRFHSGVFWTAPMLMLGAALGSWFAWKWMQGA